MKLFDYFIMPLCLTKARKIEKHSRPYIKGKVLDLGAGRCLIAKEIMLKHNKKKSEVACCDVIDVNKTDLKLTLYDGKKLPYKTNQFDTVIIAYVLHHCDRPFAVLKEALRVCRGKIIIFEDTEMGPFKKIVDSAVNKMNSKEINIPMNFMTERQWLATFKRMGLKLVHKEDGVEKEWFYPFVRHSMFVVKK